MVDSSALKLGGNCATSPPSLPLSASGSRPCRTVSKSSSEIGSAWPLASAYIFGWVNFWYSLVQKFTHPKMYELLHQAEPWWRLVHPGPRHVRIDRTVKRAVDFDRPE